MSTAVSVETSSPSRTILTVICKDGKYYYARPFKWDLEKVTEYWQRMSNIGIFSDDIPKSEEGFLQYIIASNSVWFEVLDDRYQNIGFVYLSDMVKSMTENRFLNATWHAIVWDSKVSIRIEMAKELLGYIFRVFKLHRLNAMIPLKFGGAIRTCKKLGFKEEGVLREARRYNGIWFGVLILSILESEIANG